MRSSDSLIRDILETARTIAVVGFSAKPERPSHYVTQYLQSWGYRCIPVNPGLAGQTFLGETVYADLASIPEAIDMVDIFRRSEEVGPVVEAAIAKGAKAIWMQLDVINAEAADKAEAAGLKVVMDRCPKIEIPRLGIAKRG